MHNTAADTPDETLARHAGMGDRACFAAILARHRDRVFRLCYRSAGNAEDAEDWAQECFVRAYQQLGKYDSRRPFAPWLYSVAANVCVNMARSRKRAGAGLEAGVDLPDEVAGNPANNPEAMFLSEEQRRAVVAAIGKLDSPMREAVILRVLEGVSFKELGQMFGVPLSTASTWVRRALERVRKDLSQEGMEVVTW